MMRSFFYGHLLEGIYQSVRVRLIFSSRQNYGGECVRQNEVAGKGLCGEIWMKK